MRKRIGLAAWVLVLVLAVFLMDRGQVKGDGLPRWEALDTLVRSGVLDDGKYSLVFPLTAAPIYWAGHEIAERLSLSDEAHQRLLRHIVQRWNKIFVLGFLIWGVLFVRRHMRQPVEKAVWVCPLLLFCTLLMPHARDFYSECMWTLLMCIYLSCLLALQHPRESRHPKRAEFWTVIVLTLAVPVNPLLAPVIAVTALVWAGIQRFLKDRHILEPDLICTGLGLLAGTIVCLGENALRRDGVLDFGYPGEGFSTPFLYGLAGQIAAPARGILFFIPSFFLAIPLLVFRRDLPPSLTRWNVLSFLFGWILMGGYAGWHAWHGAWYWGPRFLLPLSIFGGVYLYQTAWVGWGCDRKGFRILFVVMTVVSFMIYKVGAAVGQTDLVACLQNQPLTDDCYWRWAFTPLASWVRLEDLTAMLWHRSTVVEGVVAVFLCGVCRLRNFTLDLDSFFDTPADH